MNAPRPGDVIETEGWRVRVLVARPDSVAVEMRRVRPDPPGRRRWAWGEMRVADWARLAGRAR